MNGKRWGWIGLAVVVVAAGICVFYFMSNTKSEQWIGVADSASPPSAETQNALVRVTDPGEPAPPASGEADVDLTKTEAASEISGEITTGVAVGENGSPGSSVRVDVDPAILDAIGQTLWTTLQPIYDPLLTTIDAPKSDMLCQVLLGGQNPIQEMKLPAPTLRPSHKVITDDRQRVSNEEGRLQDLLTQTQSIRDASWSDTNVPRGALQTISSPGELGATGSALRANPITKQPLSGTLPLGH